MSRKYMNDRWCVRCGRTTPSPYMVRNMDNLFGDRSALEVTDGAWTDLAVLDIGCGNGRNVNALQKLGCKNVVGFDMAGDVGHPFTLGKRPLPIFESSADIILANYVMMFLNKTERKQVIRDIKRIAKDDCRIVVELYPAKDSNAKTVDEAKAMLAEIFNALGWQKLTWNCNGSQQKFIARNLGQGKRKLTKDEQQCNTAYFSRTAKGRKKPNGPRSGKRRAY